MNEALNIPPDDLNRKLTVARPDGDPALLHLGIGTGTYTVLVSGKQTAGRYCLIDMYVPPGDGPPPHRHDFEEMFTILEGELEFIFRGTQSVLRAGETANIPANAPHQFKNKSNQPARMLCLCAPAGQEDFFAEVGVRLPGRTTPPPKLDDDAKAAVMAKSQSLAAKYKTEFLKQA